MARKDPTLVCDGYKIVALPENVRSRMAAHVKRWKWPEAGTAMPAGWAEIFNTGIEPRVSEPSGKKRAQREIRDSGVATLLSTLIKGTATGIFVLASEPGAHRQAEHVDKRVEATGSLSEADSAEETGGFVLFSVTEQEVRLNVVPGSHKAELNWDPNDRVATIKGILPIVIEVVIPVDCYIIGHKRLVHGGAASSGISAKASARVHFYCDEAETFTTAIKVDGGVPFLYVPAEHNNHLVRLGQLTTGAKPPKRKDVTCVVCGGTMRRISTSTLPPYCKPCATG